MIKFLEVLPPAQSIIILSIHGNLDFQLFKSSCNVKTDIGTGRVVSI
jgi:hypothetical protein